MADVTTLNLGNSILSPAGIVFRRDEGQDLSTILADENHPLSAKLKEAFGQGYQSRVQRYSDARRRYLAGYPVSFLMAASQFTLNIKASVIDRFFLTNCVHCPFRQGFQCHAGVDNYHGRTCKAGKTSRVETHRVDCQFPNFLFSIDDEGQYYLHSILELVEETHEAYFTALFTGNTYVEATVCRGSVNSLDTLWPMQSLFRILGAEFNGDLSIPRRYTDQTLIDWLANLAYHHSWDAEGLKKLHTVFSTFDVWSIDTSATWHPQPGETATEVKFSIRENLYQVVSNRGTYTLQNDNSFTLEES
jgi:hypothetical protein